MKLIEREVIKIKNKYIVYEKTEYGFYIIARIKDQIVFDSKKQLEKIFNEWGMTINKYNKVVLLSR